MTVFFSQIFGFFQIFARVYEDLLSCELLGLNHIIQIKVVLKSKFSKTEQGNVLEVAEKSIIHFLIYLSHVPYYLFFQSIAEHGKIVFSCQIGRNTFQPTRFPLHLY